MKEKWSIDKLNGINWNTWKFQVKHLLLAKGLWGLVERSEVLADDATTTAQTLPIEATKGVLGSCVGD